MIEEFLRRHLEWVDIGYEKYHEKFTRYIVYQCRFFSLRLHQIQAPEWQKCHDHPWSFLTFLIWPGYQERVEDKIYRRWPGMILWRPAKFTHAVYTPYGTSWSLVLLMKKSNEWSFKECR